MQGSALEVIDKRELTGQHWRIQGKSLILYEMHERVKIVIRT